MMESNISARPAGGPMCLWLRTPRWPNLKRSRRPFRSSGFARPQTRGCPPQVEGARAVLKAIRSNNLKKVDQGLPEVGIVGIVQH